MTDAIPLKLYEIARRGGYDIEHKATVYVRGWPQASTKPFRLRFKDGTHIASFSTVQKLELALRLRTNAA